jgi:hypothetical protein
MEGLGEFSFEVEERINKAAKKASEPSRSFRSIHKRVVCRYWLTNTCSKGDACEFLHEFVTEKMPECRKGQMCADPSCMLRHAEKSDVPLCPNYEAGFCSFGFSCSWRHEPKSGPPPQIASFFLLQDPSKEAIQKRAKANPNWRRAVCPYYKHDGWCPYFSICAFKH